MPTLKRSSHEARASTQIYLVTDAYSKARGLGGLSPHTEACTGPTGAAREEVGPEVPKKWRGCSCRGSPLRGYQDTFAACSSKSEENNPQQQAHWVVLIPTLPAEIALAEKEHFTTFSCCTT